VLVRTGTRNNTRQREAPCRRLDQSTSGSQQSPWASERRRGRHCHADAALCPRNRRSCQNARSRRRGALCRHNKLRADQKAKFTHGVEEGGCRSLLQSGRKRHSGERRELIVVEEQGPGNTKGRHCTTTGLATATALAWA